MFYIEIDFYNLHGWFSPHIQVHIQCPGIFQIEPGVFSHTKSQRTGPYLVRPYENNERTGGTPLVYFCTIPFLEMELRDLHFWDEATPTPVSPPLWT